MAGNAQEAAHRLDLPGARRLAGSERIEADHHDRVHAGDERVIERNDGAVVGHALHLMVGRPVCAAACPAKAAKLGFWTWSRKPAMP